MLKLGGERLLPIGAGFPQMNADQSANTQILFNDRRISAYLRVHPRLSAGDYANRQRIPPSSK